MHNITLILFLRQMYANKDVNATALATVVAAAVPAGHVADVGDN